MLWCNVYLSNWDKKKNSLKMLLQHSMTIFLLTICEKPRRMNIHLLIRCTKIFFVFPIYFDWYEYSAHILGGWFRYRGSLTVDGAIHFFNHNKISTGRSVTLKREIRKPSSELFFPPSLSLRVFNSSSVSTTSVTGKKNVKKWADNIMCGWSGKITLVTLIEEHRDLSS